MSTPTEGVVVGPTVTGPGLIRSEERLTVHTEQVGSGSVRLEKVRVTETRTLTVDVEVEKVRLIWTAPDGTQTVVDEPPATDEVPGDAGRALVASSAWLVRSEEQVSVTKAWVPVERIRLDTFLVTQEHTLTEDVRSEQIEVITDPPDLISTPGTAASD